MGGGGRNGKMYACSTNTRHISFVIPGRRGSFVIPGRRDAASPESITTSWEFGFRACALRRIPE
jgi:hypothetical protein